MLADCGDGTSSQSETCPVRELVGVDDGESWPSRRIQQPLEHAQSLVDPLPGAGATGGQAKLQSRRRDRSLS